MSVEGDTIGETRERRYIYIYIYIYIHLFCFVTLREFYE